MVNIIDKLGSSGDPPFEFKVYRSPNDENRVLGYLTPYGVIHSDDKQATWIMTPFGVPVAEAYLRALGLAERYGIETIWVNDPDGLFPASARGGHA